MIRYIRLKNYRSFTELNLNLMSKNNVPLKLAIIYGENGSGKSNLISVFDFLHDTFQTMNIKRIILQFLDQNPNNERTQDLAALSYYTDISRIIYDNKTIGSAENMVIEFGFMLNNKAGSYLVEFDSEKIVREKLEYTLSKNKGIYYDISQNESRINNSVFYGFKRDLSEMITKYWGKHSVISLINNAREEFTSEYFESNLNPSFLTLLNYLNSICIYISDSNSKYGIINNRNNLSPNMYTSGEVPTSELFKLDKAEHQLDMFFKSTYRDIRKVFYNKEYTKDTIKYELFFVRYISGKERIVHFSDESCGTQNLIYLLPYCVAATKGSVVAIDEIDNGIHDILLLNMLHDLNKDITGQVLITTHNTLLLNEYDFKDSFLFIEIDTDGKRKIKKPSDFGYRIQPDSNVFLNYIQGRFNGLPWKDMSINFHDIASE